MIRVANKGDLDRIMVLIEDFHKATHLNRYSSFDDSEQSWSEFVSTCIDKDGMICLVDDEVLSVSMSLLGCAFWNPDVKIVQELVIWVADEARGKGLGSEMIEAVASIGKEHGAKYMAAGSTVRCHPKKMGAMLSKCGFFLEERNYMRAL